MVSNIFYVHSFLGKCSNLTNIFQLTTNQFFLGKSKCCVWFSSCKCILDSLTSPKNTDSDFSSTWEKFMKPMFIKQVLGPHSHAMLRSVSSNILEASPTLPGAHARLCTTFTWWIGLGWGGSTCMSLMVENVLPWNIWFNKKVASKSSAKHVTYEKKLPPSSIIRCQWEKKQRWTSSWTTALRRCTTDLPRSMSWVFDHQSNSPRVNGTVIKGCEIECNSLQNSIW